VRSPASRWTLVSAGALAAVLSLSACTDAPEDAAPAPASAVPSAVVKPLASDVGQYFVTPREGLPKADVEGTIAKLRRMPGVQSAELNKEGVVDVQFLGSSTPAQRTAAVQQMAAIGEVVEGV
jgi:hypothetical protein